MLSCSEELRISMNIILKNIWILIYHPFRRGSWRCTHYYLDSVLSKKIGSFGYFVVQATRRTFFYGILFMIPALFIFDFKWNLTRFATPAYLFNIFYLGLGASAICFVTWNMAVRILGAIKTSVYIYLAPVVTAVTSVIILHEKITFLSGLGILLVLGGLLLSEQKEKIFFY